MASFLADFSVNFFLVSLMSLLAFWLVGRGFCRFRRILAATLILSALVTLLCCLAAMLNEPAGMIAGAAAFLCVLTVPYFLSRYVLLLPLSRALIASVLFLLLIMILGSIAMSGY